MDTGQRAVTILAILQDAWRALDADDDVDAVICRGLAEALAADSAICFLANGDRTAKVLAGHPRGSRPASLAKRLPVLLDGLSHLPVVREDPEIGQLLLVSPGTGRELGAARGRRGYAFARQTGFELEDRRLLAEAVPVLVMLAPQVARAADDREHRDAGQAAAKEYGLTARELEVLQLLAQGLLATSIAARLDLSPRTVHKHLGNIYDKLGVHDRLVAVSLARSRGLVTG